VPQRRALEVGLLRAEPAVGEDTGRRVLGTAFRSVLAGLASVRPVLLAIDDAQWLDGASRHVLEFALRRLTVERVGVLLTRRTGRAAQLVLGTPPDRTRLIALRGLDAEVLHRIVSARFDRPIARPALIRIARASAGNPMFAIEMARALLEATDDTTGVVPPPIPDDLRELLLRRLHRLPAGSRYALLSVAAQPDLRPSPADVRALAPAERAGVVVLDRGRVRFTHPLLAAAIYGATSAADRRRVHEELSGRPTNHLEQRARHLALAAAGPDEDIAAALTDAAAQIRSRGAPDAAADLLELAVSLTPGDGHTRRRERVIAAAENHFHAGDRARARLLAADVVAVAPADELAGRALRLLGMVNYHEDSYRDAIGLFTTAVQRLGEHPLSVDVLVNLAHAHASTGDMAASTGAAEMALAQARRFGDRALEAVALAVSAMAGLLIGRPVDWPTNTSWRCGNG
jgi:tetratricopeptide (TPR) repeat protein